METNKQPLKVEIEKILIRAAKSFEITKQVCEIENLYKGQTKPLLEEIEKLKGMVISRDALLSELEQSLSLSQKENEELKKEATERRADLQDLEDENKIFFNTNEKLQLDCNNLKFDKKSLIDLAETLELDKTCLQLVNGQIRRELGLDIGDDVLVKIHDLQMELTSVKEQLAEKEEALEIAVVEIEKNLNGWKDLKNENFVKKALTNYKLKDK